MLIEDEVLEDEIEIEDTGTPEEIQPDIEDTPEKSSGDFKFDDTTYREEGWSDKQIEVLRKKDEQIWNKDKLIHKQSEEVGAVRKKELEYQQKEADLTKKLTELTAQEEELKDYIYEDPDAYKQAVINKKRVEDELSDVLDKRQSLTAEQTIYVNVPDFDSLISSDIPEVIKQDGIRAGWSKQDIDAAISDFKLGGWRKINPSQVLFIAERAKMIKTLREKDEEIKRLKRTPDEIGKKIAQISGQRPIASSSTSFGDRKTFSSKDLSSMTDAEIKQELNKRLNGG